MLGQLTIKTFKDGILIRESGPFYNKVVSSNGYGRNLILRALSGDTTYPVVINSASVGNSATAPADADTGLGASLVASIPITNMSVLNNILTVDVFVADGSLANNTYKEFGLFCTARLLSRLIISPDYVKGTGQDTLFTYTLTMTG